MIGTQESPFTMADHGHREVAPDRLRLLGKQASAMHSERGVPLTDAVVQVLGSEQNLGPEHVRRVVEFANTYAFDSEFGKQAGDHRVVNFDTGPADPSDVMSELRSGATPAVSARPSPMTEPTGYVPGAEGALAEAFGMNVKTASVSGDYPYENPHGELFALKDTLAAARDQLTSELSALEIQYDAAADALYKEARQVITDGNSPADVSSVVASAAPHPVFVKLALKLVSKRMEQDHVPAVPMRKTASFRLANPEHPLYQATQEFSKVAGARFHRVAAVEKLNEQLDQVMREVKKVLQ